MKTKAQKEALTYESGIASGKLEELHLIVPKGVANKFRHLANKLGMTTHALFEEMVDTHAHGSDLG